MLLDMTAQECNGLILVFRVQQCVPNRQRVVYLILLIAQHALETWRHVLRLVSCFPIADRAPSAVRQLKTLLAELQPDGHPFGLGEIPDPFTEADQSSRGIAESGEYYFRPESGAVFAYLPTGIDAAALS